MQFAQLKRREFFSLLCGAATWPLVAHTQQLMPVIGFLSGRSAGEAASAVDAFREGLGKIGYIEGKTSLSNIAGRKVITPGFQLWRPSWWDGRLM